MSSMLFNLSPSSFYSLLKKGRFLFVTMLVVISNPVHAEDAFRLELKTEISEDGYDEEQLHWHGYENGQPVTFDVDPYTSFWKRFAVGVMSILPIESQL